MENPSMQELKVALAQLDALKSALILATSPARLDAATYLLTVEGTAPINQLIATLKGHQ